MKRKALLEFPVTVAQSLQDIFNRLDRYTEAFTA
jgi:hypothetical protein